MEGKVGDVLRRRRQPRDMKIWGIIRLGWTKTKAGELFGLEHDAARNISKKVEENAPIVRSQFYSKRKSLDKICSFTDIDAEKGG